MLSNTTAKTNEKNSASELSLQLYNPLSNKNSLPPRQLVVHKDEERQSLRRERIDKLLHPQSMQAMGHFFQYLGNIGEHTKSKQLKDIGSIGAALSEGAAVGGALTGNPIGMAVGAIVSTISFLSQKRRAKKNAKKPDPFVQYMEHNFSEIRQNFEAMSRQISDLHQDLIVGVNMIMEELSIIHQQNLDIQEAIHTSTERILTHLNRNSDQISEGFHNILQSIHEGYWSEAEEWVEQAIEPSVDIVVNNHKKLFDVIKLTRSKAANPAHTGLSLLESSRNSNMNAIYEWTKRTFHSNSLESLGSIISYLACFGNHFFNWQLESNCDNPINISSLFNPYIWAEGVDRYIEFITRFHGHHHTLDPNHARLDEIISAGQNFLNFINFLQSAKPLNILKEYLRTVAELEQFILEHYLLIPGAALETKTVRLETFKNFLTIPNELLRNRCNKIDTLLNLFKACCSLAGYNQVHLESIDKLWNSNQILQSVLHHANQPKANELNIGFPYFHLAMVKKVYIHSNKHETLPSTPPHLDVANMEGLYNTLLYQTTRSGYFNSSFQTAISQKLTLLRLIKQAVITNSFSQDVSKKLSDPKVIFNYQSQLVDIFNHYREDYEIWFDNSEESNFKKVSIKNQKSQKYTQTSSEILSATRHYQLIEQTFQNKDPNLEVLAASLKELNASCKKIHKNYKFLLNDYKFTDSDFVYLDEDYKILSDLYKSISNSGSPNLSLVSKSLTEAEESQLSEDERQQQNDFVRYILENDDLRNAIFDGQNNNHSDLADVGSLFTNRSTCFMSDMQRRFILLYEAWRLPRQFLPLPDVVRVGNGLNYRLNFINKGIVWLTPITIGNQSSLDREAKNHLGIFLNQIINQTALRHPIYICLHLDNPEHFTTLCVQRTHANRISYRYIDSLRDTNNLTTRYSAIKQSLQTVLQELFANNVVEEIQATYTRQQHMPEALIPHNSECGMHNVFNTLHMLTSQAAVNMDTMHHELKMPVSNRSGNGGLDPEAGLELAVKYRCLIRKFMAHPEVVNSAANNKVISQSGDKPLKQDTAVVSTIPTSNQAVNIPNQRIVDRANSLKVSALTAAAHAEGSLSTIISYCHQCSGALPGEGHAAEAQLIAGHRRSEMSRHRATVVAILHSQSTRLGNISCVDEIDHYSGLATDSRNRATTAENAMKNVKDGVIARQTPVHVYGGFRKLHRHR